MTKEHAPCSLRLCSKLQHPLQAIALKLIFGFFRRKMQMRVIVSDKEGEEPSYLVKYIKQKI